MSRLVEHAVKELLRVGLFDHADVDYNGKLAVDVTELVILFAKQGHSGASAELTIDLFTKLAKREML